MLSSKLSRRGCKNSLRNITEAEAKNPNSNRLTVEFAISVAAVHRFEYTRQYHT